MARSARKVLRERPQRHPVALGAALLCLQPLAVPAGEWDFTPRLSIGETYTDNVRLAEDGERGDFITTITPGISVRGESPRLSTSIDYNLQQLLYAHETRFDSTNHQLQGLASATLVEDWLYFDTQSQVSQQNIDNRGRITNNNRGPDGNRRDVVSYEFTPRLEHTFGSWFNLSSSYTHQTLDQSGGATGFVGGNSSVEEAWQVSVGSGRRFARFPVRLTTLHRQVDFDDGRSFELKSYSGEGSYVLNRKLRMTATGGYDKNTFPTARGNNSGPFWTVGGTWTPSERTTLSGNWGNRFFGDTFNVSGNHRRRRLTISGGYSEQIQTANEFERQLLLVPLLDPQGQPIFDPVTSSQILIPLEVPTVTNDTFLTKQVNASMSYTLRRGDVGVRFFQYDRQFQAGDFDELTRGASLSSSWRLSPRLSWSLNLTWRSNERSNSDIDGNFYTLNPAVRYRLGPHTTAQFLYELTYNDGVGLGLGSGDRYVENALSANLVFNL